MRRAFLLAAATVALATAGCCIPEAAPEPLRPVITTTTTSDGAGFVHCAALGCPGNPPDASGHCDSGLTPIAGKCPEVAP